ncbi:MAG: protein kinase, partial [Thermoanaerobaculia bacterium]|nr:protein kinase [Thermoanaerobaculia bacterium]
MSDQETGSDRSAARSAAFDRQIGDVFAGRYRLDRLIGNGAAGVVWAAHDEEVGDRIALKLLVAGPDDAAERFRREVRLARRVTHRNAARIFDLGHAEGLLYLTMELIEGESLRDRIARLSAVDPGQAAEIVSQIARGLAAAHGVDVIHRDIKPANVLIEPGGRVVVTDFGLARATAKESDVTVDATMIGTPAYMAPEQVRGDTAVGPATDLYALGAVFYELLTGRCPFVRETAVATAMARLTHDPEDPRALADIPDVVADLVMRCLQRRAEARPASALEVVEALAGIARPLDETDATATLLAPASRSPSPSAVASSPLSSRFGSGSSATFISILPEDRTLAVLPFRHRGPEEHGYLAEDLAEDLVDALAATRGLRVTASGATARYQGRSVDPREAGRELGVDGIVDGRIRIGGGRVGISARLIDVDTGEQLWVDRFDEDLEAAIELNEMLAQRVAESLRVELELLAARHSVPAEAIALYNEARRRTPMATDDDVLNEALAFLDRALDLAPDFALAQALHAEYAVRRWFLPAGQNDEAVATRAHESVERALVGARYVPTTHFAAGRLAVSDGRFADAARELTQALSLAPTYAAVHDYLGMLQCEAGRSDEGERHIEIAAKLDPSLNLGLNLARLRALEGDLDRFRRVIASARAKSGASRFAIDSLEMRVAGWFGDTETVRRTHPGASIPPEHPFYAYIDAQRSALLGEGSREALIESYERVMAAGSGPRFNAFMRQLAIEALIPLGEHELAMAELRLAGDSPSFV